MLKNTVLPRPLSISKSVKINCSETTIQGLWCISEKCPVIFVTSSCLSVRPHVSAWLLAEGFPWNLMRADLYENLSKNFKFVYNRTKVSDILHEDVNTFYCCRLHKFAIKAFLCNAHNICSDDSDSQLNSARRTHYCVFIATVLMWTGDNSKLYVHCLSCRYLDYWYPFQMAVSYRNLQREAYNEYYIPTVCDGDMV